MKHSFIHKTALVFSTLLCLTMSSCLKEGDKTILVNDPQIIPFITEYLPEDLLNLFGEENVYFGDQPPVVNAPVCRHQPATPICAAGGTTFAYHALPQNQPTIPPDCGLHQHDFGRDLLQGDFSSVHDG